MHIAIIGSGNMGRTLGARFAQLGYEVVFSDIDSRRAEDAARIAGPRASTGSAEDAASAAAVVVWTLRGILPSQVFSSVSALDGKVLVDLNNSEIPPDFAYEPVTLSLAERIATDAPGAKVVKAFNTLAMEPYELSADALRAANAATFLAADDPLAKATVAELAEGLGLRGIDAGPLRNARLLEGLADLVRFLMTHGHGPDVFFTLGKANPPAQTRLGGRQEAFFQ